MRLFEILRGERRAPRTERLVEIAQVHSAPQGEDEAPPDQVAQMAGYDYKRGYDAMEGVDDMATPGGADPLDELQVGSQTDGGALDLADNESIFGSSDDEDYDWCRCL